MVKTILALVTLVGVSIASVSKSDIIDISFSTGVVESWDAFGSPNNETSFIDLGSGWADYHVIGIGWNVNLTALGNSFLSHLAVRFIEGGVTLTPGAGQHLPGTQNFSSGGVVDLIGLGADWNQGSNILNLQFFEVVDDVVNAIDGRWNTGTLTVRVERSGVSVPEPATFAVLSIAGFGLLAIRRRP